MLRHVCLVYLVLLAAAGPAAAQWEPAGPARERIQSYASDASYVYAGSTLGGGVYRSNDHGRSWARFTAGLASGTTFRSVLKLAAAGGVVVAGTDNGPYRSTNDGENWALARTGITTQSPYVERLVAVGDAFVARTGSSSDRKLFRSTDGGVNWSVIADGLFRQDATIELLGVGDTLFVVALKPGSARHQLFRSNDLGDTWSEYALPGLFTVANGVLAYSNGRLFSSGPTSAGIYYSDDDGQSWTQSHQNASVTGLTAHGNTVVAIASRSVLTSTNHGATWEVAVDGLPMMDAALHGPFWAGEAFLVAREMVYPFRSTDGLTWEPSGQGMAQEVIMNGIVARGNVLVASYNLGLFRSDDGGRQWSVPTLPTTGNIQGIVATDSTFIAIGQQSIINSVDGLTWKRIGSPENWTFQRLFVTDEAIYAATQRAGLVKSTDGGYTWTYVNGTPGKLIDVWVRDDVILLGDGNPSTPILLASTDDGETWTSHINIYASTVAATETMFFSAINHVLSGRKLWRSPDAVTWTEIVSPGPIARLYAVGNTLFANLANNGVWWSTDNGDTWQGEAVGFPPGSAYSASHLIVNGETMYLSVGSGSGTGGVWRLTLPEGVVTDSEPDASLPRSMSLQPAYPNPFNPSTTAEFSLAQPSHVRLAVYDVLGRQIALLADGVLPAGTHRRQWTASLAASGTYLIRLEAAGRVETQTIVLLK